MTTTKSVPIPFPTAPTSVSADQVISGLPLPAIDRIKVFSDRQWEEFVLEWVDSLRKEYASVERCGGAGDLGRDVLATCVGGNGDWDNYQCKHYSRALMPTDIYVELAKLMYYTHLGIYSYPRRYYFVAPRGAGTRLSNLLKKPAALRTALIENWDTSCAKGITSTKSVPLVDPLKSYVDNADFSIFEAIPPLRLIDGHAKSRWHAARFGGGLPARPPAPTPPAAPTTIEVRYVRHLLDAYGEYLGKAVASVEQIGNPDLEEHLGDSRLEFYSAESLRAFSRDTLPPGEFERLQGEVHSGIRDELRSEHPDGYRRVVAVVRTARSLAHTGHALSTRLSVRDHGGICHQLANDDKVRWIK